MKKLSLFALLPFLMFTENMFAKHVEATGTAKAKDGQVTYIEHHKMKYSADGDLLSIQTSYKSSEKKRFGHLHSEFKNHPFIPEHTFVDDRFGRMDRLEWINEREFRLVSRSEKGKKVKESRMKLKNNMISGQGLHNFLFKNIERLKQKNAEIEVKYIIPMNHDYYSLRLKHIKYIAAVDTVVIRMEFSNWFMRLLAPSIDLHYGVNDRKLLKYVGTSNLLDQSKKQQKIQIDYAYPQKVSEASFQ